MSLPLPQDRLEAIVARHAAATDEINWRRFFDVTSLGGLRQEVPEVFEATHELILKLYAEGAIDGVLPFPLFTIENVDRVDETHIIVGNDNNLPFSSSRDPNKADDNEFVLLEVGDFLKAK